MLDQEDDEYDDAEEEYFRIKSVTLREGSWFGDYHILTNIKSNFELKASRAAKSSQGSTGKIAANLVQIFKLNA